MPDVAAVEVRFATIDPPSYELILPVTPVSWSLTSQARWGSAMPLQGSREILSYQGTMSARLTVAPFDVVADSLDESRAVSETLARLRALQYVAANQTRIGGLNRPARVLVVWPQSFSVTVVLEQVDVEAQRFFGPELEEARGAARAWRVTLGMRRWMDSRVSAEDVLRGRDGFGASMGTNR